MKTRLVSLCISVLLILTFTACSLNKSGESTDDSTSQKSLTILNGAHYSIDLVIDELKNLHPEILIEQKLYDELDMAGDNEKTVTELMAGKGPDVLILRVGNFRNLYKMVDNKTFLNLDDFIKSYRSFNMDELNQNILKCGVYDGKRYLIPLYYGLPVMITTKSFLSTHKLNISESGATMSDLTELAAQFLKDNKNQNKYLFSDDFNFDNLLFYNSMKYIDYTKRKSSFDSIDFISTLNNFKDIQSTVCPGEVAQKEEVIGLLKNGTIGLVQYSAGIGTIEAMYSYIKQYMGEDMCLIPILDDGKTVLLPADAKFVVGINANSPNKKEAFEFLKVLLEKEGQTPYLNTANTRYISGLPVNIKAMKEELRYYMSNEIIAIPGETHGGLQYKYSPLPLSKALGERIEKLNGNITKGQINDYRVLSIIKQETKDFLDDKITAEQSAKAIDQKVMLYLNE